MNNEQLEFTENYYFGDKSIFNSSSKIAQDWFTLYATDKNSSTVREHAALNYLGYIKNPDKHGHDGWHPIRKKYVEVKPQYAHLDKNDKQVKLGGGGSFNDITHEKIKSIPKWDIVCSGFAEDKAIFIARFPAKYICEFLTTRLNRITNPKTRKSVRFGWNQYKDCKNLEILWFDNESADKFMSKGMYKLFHKLYNK
jgi:hypothetical protein